MPAAKKGRGRPKKVLQSAEDPAGDGDVASALQEDQEEVEEIDKPKNDVKKVLPVASAASSKMRGRGRPKKVSGEKSKKKRKANYGNFSYFIYKVLKQVHPGKIPYHRQDLKLKTLIGFILFRLRYFFTGHVYHEHLQQRYV